MKLHRNDKEILSARLLIGWREVERSSASLLLEEARAEGKDYLTVQELLEQARDHLLANQRKDLLPEKLAEYLTAAPLSELREIARSHFPRDRYTATDFKNMAKE